MTRRSLLAHSWLQAGLVLAIVVYYSQKEDKAVDDEGDDAESQLGAVPVPVGSLGGTSRLSFKRLSFCDVPDRDAEADKCRAAFDARIKEAVLQGPPDTVEEVRGYGTRQTKQQLEEEKQRREEEKKKQESVENQMRFYDEGYVARDSSYPYCILLKDLRPTTSNPNTYH